MREPQEGQTLTHRQFGGHYEVTRVDGGSVKVTGTDGRGLTMNMRVEQLWEHFAPLT